MREQTPAKEDIIFIVSLGVVKFEVSFHCCTSEVSVTLLREKWSGCNERQCFPTLCKGIKCKQEFSVFKCRDLFTVKTWRLEDKLDILPGTSHQFCKQYNRGTFEPVLETMPRAIEVPEQLWDICYL